MFYLVNTPWVVKKFIYPRYIWNMPGKEKKIYLSFDDGPHPTITPIVLEQLKEHNAKASFFCIGKNVAENPDLYKQIIEEGHSVGNHTHNHLNGWEVNDKAYLKNITTAAKYIDSSLFRPPYGRITRFQAKQVMEILNYDIIMWSVLSGDFDSSLSPEDCWNNVLKATGAGSIVVFHDSEKAKKRVLYALPKLLTYYSERGYSFERIII
ncbi:MAG: polysaccharide deacetylase family protein [Chitinophagaceae bacterium]